MTIASISDFRAAARRRLPRVLFDYLDGGSFDEVTLLRNVEAMRAVRLRQRVMHDVSTISLKTNWFGRELSMPVGLGPVGFSGMFARRGEAQAARAASAAGVPLCLSTLSICDVDEVARASADPIWFQCYIVKDRGFMERLLERVAAAGVTTLALTVDLPIAGTRYRDFRSGMSGGNGALMQLRRAWQGLTHPEWLWDVQFNGRPHAFGNLRDAVTSGSGLGNFSAWVSANFDASVTWRTLDWLRARWKGAIIVKGVLDVEDARAAAAEGVDGLIVSNHGGRQLDGAIASIEALPAIVDAVGHELTVLMDGGVRSGLDVLRAMALGAKGVLIGRAWAYALAAQGERGVARALDVIRNELTSAMTLTGCTDVREISRALVA